MKWTHRGLLFAILVVAVARAPIHAQELGAVRIPFERFTLDNGLRVIVHSDMSSRSVKVTSEYFVGSRDEPEGRSGFAHLYEHLMLQGSANSDEPTLVTMKRLGGAANGLTSYDHTSYYESGPYTTLEYILWLEADRMGNFLDSLTQEKLDAQRGVVQNEKRQRGFRTLQELPVMMNAALLPPDHPYAHPTIGSMEDLDAASLDDVKDWFRRFYGPGNAQLIVSGRVAPDEARALVEKYFGWIPAGEPVDRMTRRPPMRVHNTAEVLQADDVVAPVIQRSWMVPGNGSPEAVHAQLAAAILSAKGGKWLRRQLVDERKIASNLFFSVGANDLVSRASLRVTLAAGQDVDTARAAIDEILERFREEGPSHDDVSLLRERNAASYLVGMDYWASRASWLAWASRALGDPDLVHDYFGRIDTASPIEIRDAARAWLNDGYHEIVVLPFDREAATGRLVDMSVVPPIAKMAPVTVPEFETATRPNGIRLFLAPIDNSPVTTVVATVRGGDQMNEGVTPGSAGVLVELMQRATRRLDKAKLSDRLERLGSSLKMYTESDLTGARVRTVTSRLDRTLGLLAEMMISPRLDDPAGLDQVRAERLRRHRQLRQKHGKNLRDAATAAVFGDDHPLGGRFRTDEATIAALNLEELRQIHAAWFRPDNLSLYVSGNLSMDELVDLVDDSFGKWRSGADARSQVKVPAVAIRDTPLVLLSADPDAEQSGVGFSLVLPRLEGKEKAALEVLHARLSGAFDSRLNMDLREDKGWTYGVKGALMATGQYLRWMTNSAIQTDRTLAGITVMVREIRRLRGEEPVTQEELDRARAARIEAINSRYTHSFSRATYLHETDRYGHDPKEPEQLQGYYEALTPEDVLAAARKWLAPERIVWTIRGDLELIEDGIRELGLGEVVVVD